MYLRFNLLPSRLERISRKDHITIFRPCPSIAAGMRSQARPKEGIHRKPGKRTAKADLSPFVEEHGVFPFLTLPPEIRVMIMRYYFGSHRVHIIQGQPLEWSARRPRNTISARLDHRLCIVGTDYWKSRLTNEVQYKLLEGYPVEYEELHVNCNLECHRSYGGASPVRRQLDINLLFVNKQTYQEASKILYGDQTFSFTEPDDLAIFCNAMMQTQKPKLRKVQLVTEAWLLERGDAHEGFSNAIRLHPWLEEVLPALKCLTDLRLIVRIKVLGVADWIYDRVGAGAVQTLHRAVRWHFGFLRQLTSLQNVVVDIQDPDGLVDPEYIPTINAAFEAELLSPSSSDLKRSEEEEQSWRSDVANLNYTLSTNADERVRLSSDLKRYQRHCTKAQRDLQQQSKAIERLRARSKDPSEKQKEKLAREQATLEHAERNVKTVQEMLAPAEALDRGALEEELRVLQGKIAARDERVFRYIKEFEAGRGRAGSGRP